jgi:ATP-binding cassette, subfamily B, bacterial PglK
MRQQANFDVTTQKEIIDAVSVFHGNKTVVIVAHRMSTIADCDCVFRLEEGQLLEAADVPSNLSESRGVNPKSLIPGEAAAGR